MTEAQLQKAVIKTAQQLGWKVAHFRTSMTARGTYATAVAGDGVGFPDLVMVKRPRLAFVELKMDGKYPRPSQREWLSDLDYTGSEVYVWRPKDWLDDTIINILKEKPLDD